MLKCLACNLTIDSKKHICAADVTYFDQSKFGLKCLGCKKEFSKIVLFDTHITGLHSDDVQTMFFPTLSGEFNFFYIYKKHIIMVWKLNKGNKNNLHFVNFLRLYLL